jgi:hypothetical protein
VDDTAQQGINDLTEATMKFALCLLLALPVMAQVNPAIPAATSVAAASLSNYKAQPASQTWKANWPQPEASGQTLYRWSVAALLSANAADTITSWQLREANPFVAGNDTHFGATSLAIKTGFVATSLILQHVALRHRPDLHKRMAWMNFISSGALGAVAAHNFSVR